MPWLGVPPVRAAGHQHWLRFGERREIELVRELLSFVLPFPGWCGTFYKIILFRFRNNPAIFIDNLIIDV